MVAARKGSVYVTQQYAVSQTEEPGVVISMRDYDRLIERLDGCKAGRWADPWLFGAGAGAALGPGALVDSFGGCGSAETRDLRTLLWGRRRGTGLSSLPCCSWLGISAGGVVLGGRSASSGRTGVRWRPGSGGGGWAAGGWAGAGSWWNRRGW